MRGKKMKIVSISVVASCLLSTIAYSAVTNNQDVGESSSSYTDTLRNTTGSKQAIVKGGKVVRDTHGQIKDNMYDTVIYNDIHTLTSSRKSRTIAQLNPKGAIGSIALASPATDQAKQELIAEANWQKREAERKALELKREKERQNPAYYVGGYCSVNTPVKIVRNSEFTILNCLLNFGEGQYRQADVFAGVYPNFKKETLTVLPIYATLQDGNKVSMDGVVLTEDKASLNIADHIERFKIRKLISEYGLTINDVAYRYANAFMSQLIASRTTQKVEYVTVDNGVDSNGNRQTSTVPVVTQRTLPPKAKDYFVMAGIELFSKIFAIGAKDLMADSDPLFRIFKGKRVYIEGVVTVDNKGMARKFGALNTQEHERINSDNAEYEREKKIFINRAENSIKRDGTGGLQTIQQQTQQAQQQMLQRNNGSSLPVGR